VLYDKLISKSALVIISIRDITYMSIKKLLFPFKNKKQQCTHSC